MRSSKTPVDAQLVDKLREQRIFQGAPRELLQEVARKTEVLSLRKGKKLIEQGRAQKFLYFILSGDGVSIKVNNTPYRTREPSEVIGELSMVSRNNLPTATVESAGNTKVGKISYRDFKSIVDDDCPGAVAVWRAIAAVAAERLQQRNVLVRKKGAVPRVFVGSSGEKLPDARCARDALSAILGDAVQVVLWTDALVFLPGSTTMVDLLDNAQTYDFALFVCGADDKVTLRHVLHAATRDNVILELGLHMGVFGDLKRALMLVGDKKPAARAAKSRTLRQRTPTDLLGMTVLKYDAARLNAVRQRSIASQMKIFAEVIRTRGPR